MADKAESKEMVVGEGVVVKNGGQEVMTKVVGSKTISSKKTVTKKVMKTSSSSSSSSSKKTITSSSSGSSQPEEVKAVSETSHASSDQSHAEHSEATTESSSHSTATSSNTNAIQAAPSMQVAQLPDQQMSDKAITTLSNCQTDITAALGTLSITQPLTEQCEESKSCNVEESKHEKKTDTGKEESQQKKEETAAQQHTHSVSQSQDGSASSTKVSKISSSTVSKTSSTSSHKLLIHSSEDQFDKLLTDQSGTTTNKPALQILLPSTQSTTTVLTPEDLTPKAGWMGEISFDVAGFEKDSINVQSDGCNIEIHATKASVDDHGAAQEEQYAKVCQLPESPIDPFKLSSSLFQNGVMTIIVPTREVMLVERVEEAEKIQQDNQDFILTSDQVATTLAATTPAATTPTTTTPATTIPTTTTPATTTPAESTDYSKAYSSASRSVVVKKDGQTFSQVQISKTGEAAANVSSLTSLLPASQSDVEVLTEAPLMHFNVAGFAGETIEVCSDGKKVEVKAIRTSIDEEGAERKEEFARVYELPAPIDPCQLHPMLSQDGVLSLQIDSEGAVKEGGKEGEESEEMREEMVKKAESRQARQTDTGSEENHHKQEDTAAQHHSQSVSQDGSTTSSKSFKSSSSSFSSSKVSSSSSQQPTPQITSPTS